MPNAILTSLLMLYLIQEEALERQERVFLCAGAPVLLLDSWLGRGY